MLEKAVAFSHSLLKKSIIPGDIVIDGTVGNGNDTVLLASLVGKTGTVIGFDIQETAIEKTKQKLLLTGLLPQVELHHASHAQAVDFLPPNKELGGAIYNLGYLPGGDKEITTQKDSTLMSISFLLPRLRIGSLLVVVVYSGHPAGEAEKNALVDYVSQLDQKEYDVLLYQFLNQKNNPPFVLAIERKK
ncbi:class I SAM-dependent methyltransferase [Jeotgalibaca caeni]|uniref:class I SAM-dependent methyltransferase n=1 Tax=Jeotgalibaca caeni TaxID=3028623 RepID=UPI00237DFDD0|nr:class I SAM-dependent methyltransferase [Jeotgalibaca caeni]MDE1549260.1 class I SAM-dependent methyltransferase [Jeotgalibaca caeni]